MPTNFIYCTYLTPENEQNTVAHNLLLYTHTINFIPVLLYSNIIYYLKLHLLVMCREMIRDEIALALLRCDNKSLKSRSKDQQQQLESYRMQLLLSQKKLLLEEHVKKETISSINNKEMLLSYFQVKSIIGDIHFTLASFQTALSFHDQAYKILTQINSGLYPDIERLLLRAAFNVGQSLHILGKRREALRYYITIMNAIQPMLSPQKEKKEISIPTQQTEETKATKTSFNGNIINEEIIIIIQKIAWAFHQDREFSYARSFYSLALRSATTVLGENHLIIVRILNLYGNLMIEFGHASKALAYYKRSLYTEQALRRQNLTDRGSNATSYVDSLMTLSNMCQTYEMMGDKEGHLACCAKILMFLEDEGVRSSLSPSDVRRRTTSVLLSIANIRMKSLLSPSSRLCSPSTYQELQKVLTRVLHLQRQEYGNDDRLVSATLNDLGIIQVHCGHVQLAIQNFHESLQICIMLDDRQEDPQLLDDTCINASTTMLYNLAFAHSLNRDTLAALACLRELVGQHDEIQLDQDIVSLERWAYRPTRKRTTRPGRGSGPNISSNVILLSALLKMAQIYYGELNEPHCALSCLEAGLHCMSNDLNSSAAAAADYASRDVQYVPTYALTSTAVVRVLSRYLGMAGSVCLKLGETKRAVRYFIKAKRVNIAGGLAPDANIDLNCDYFRSVLIILDNCHHATTAAAPAA